LLEFDNRATGQLFCAMDVPGGSELEVLGDQGLMTLPIAFEAGPNSPPLPLQIRTAAGVVTEQFEPYDPYVGEIEAFTQAILTRAPCPIDLADSIRNAGLLDGIRKASEKGRTTLSQGDAAPLL
jgi:predicted dehydrogenase